MFSLIKWLLVLAVCLVGIGFFRGWFTMSKTSRDAETNQVNINVSIDAAKLKADAKQVKTKIAEKVGPRVKQLEDKAKALGAK